MADEFDRSSAWDFSGIGYDWGSDGGRMRSYNCPFCGAELICEDTTAATECPYCASPVMAPGQFAGALRPDSVIPFKVSKEEAVAALKGHYKGKWFLPRKFRAGNRIEKIQGLYLPFWLYDAEAEVDCRFDGQITKERFSGVGKKYTTDHYDLRRVGRMKFEKVPVDASEKLESELVEAILPYHYRSLKKFSMTYFAGYAADRAGISPEQCAEKMDEQVRRTAASAMEQMDTSSYDSVKLEEFDIRIQRGRVHYALLPVWILTTAWRGERYTFAMNGQTGKFAGDLPVSMAKFWAFLLGLTGIIGTIGAAIMQLNGGGF